MSNEEQMRAEFEAEREAMQREHDKALAGEPAVIQAAITNTTQSEAVMHDGAQPAAASQTEPAAPVTHIGIDFAKPGADKAVFHKLRPSDEVFITRIASDYEITYGESCDWILAIAERMKVAA